MVIWNILLSIFVALCCFGWLTERVKRLALTEATRKVVESQIDYTEKIANELLKGLKEYTDQSVLAHEKMAHEGYENYTTEGKVIG